MKEIWKRVPQFPNYRVSNLGRVRRDASGQGTAGGLLKPYPDKGGYLRVGLRLEGRRSTQALHRLVAMLFLPNPRHLPEVNHKHKPKTNCTVTNLEWRSRLGNSRHAVLAGFKGDGVTKLFGKWRARYYPTPGKRVHLGMFNTKQEAITVRKAALKSIAEVL
jgi:NUMOD4 motif-containing protein